MDSIISEQKAGNFLGTAHIYQASLNAFGAFTGSKNILFRQMTPALLKRFEHYLRLRGNSWNTVSTYMRSLYALSTTGQWTANWPPTLPACSNLYILEPKPM